MTDEMLNLRALVEKAPDADFQREVIGFAAERCFQTNANSSQSRHSARAAMRLALTSYRRERLRCWLKWLKTEA